MLFYDENTQPPALISLDLHLNLWASRSLFWPKAALTDRTHVGSGLEQPTEKLLFIRRDFKHSANIASQFKCLLIHFLWHILSCRVNIRTILCSLVIKTTAVKETLGFCF